MNWAVYPLHISGRLIEEKLSTLPTLGHVKLRIPEDSLDNVVYLPKSGNFHPIRAFIDWKVRKTVRWNDFLNHDHLNVYLSLITRNYNSESFQSKVIVPWTVATWCDKCSLIQRNLDENQQLSVGDIKSLSDGIRHVREFVDHFPDFLGKVDMIFFIMNITMSHFQLLVAINPQTVYKVFFNEKKDDDKTLGGFFCLDSVGNTYGNNTIPDDCGFIWFLNTAYSYVRSLKKKKQKLS